MLRPSSNPPSGLHLSPNLKWALSSKLPNSLHWPLSSDLPSSLHRPQSPNLSLHRGAGNIARSRLSGGSSHIRTRPRKRLRRGRQTGLHGILFDVSLNSVELRAISDEMIIAFVLPKWSVGAQKTIGLVSRKSFERPQPFCRNYVRSDEKMDVVRHHHERMEIVSAQDAVAVSQGSHRHLRNFRPPQEQRTARGRVQEPIDSHERLACRNQAGRREHPAVGKTAVQSEGYEQRLLDYIPMWQPPLVMPHIYSWWFGVREILTPFQSRLKAGCGQYCPPHIWQFCVFGGWVL